MGQAPGTVERPPESADQAAGQSIRSFYRNLLTENRARCQLKPIPATRYPKTRTGLHPLGENGIVSQSRHDRRPIGVQVEHGADAFHNEEEPLRIADFDPRNQQVALLIRTDFKITMPPIHADGPPVTAGFHRLNARRTARRQKVEHPLPQVRWPEIETEHVLISRLSLLPPRQTPDLSRCSVIKLADARVEAPDTAESRGQGDLSHRQTGLIDQFLREMQAARLSYHHGGCTEMAQEQAPKMPRADPESLSQNLDATVSQPGLTNQA